MLLAGCTIIQPGSSWIYIQVQDRKLPLEMGDDSIVYRQNNDSIELLAYGWHNGPETTRIRWDLWYEIGEPVYYPRWLRCRIPNYSTEAEVEFTLTRNFLGGNSNELAKLIGKSDLTFRQKDSDRMEIEFQKGNYTTQGTRSLVYLSGKLIASRVTDEEFSKAMNSYKANLGFSQWSIGIRPSD